MLKVGDVARCIECKTERQIGGCTCVVRLLSNDDESVGTILGLGDPPEVPVRVLWASDALKLGVCFPRRKWLTLLPTAEAMLYLL